MRFAYTIHCVTDVEASLAFYERAFGLARRLVAPGLRCPDCSLVKLCTARD